MIYRFDQFEVDDSEFRLSLVSTGQILQLEPKALRVLIFLLQNPNRLVSKQEILDAVWKNAYVSESVLTRIISLLRKLLGDDTREPKLIETVPTQGYRLLSVVRGLPEVAEHAPVEEAVAQPTRDRILSFKSAKLSLGRVSLLAAALIAAAILFPAFRTIRNSRVEKRTTQTAMTDRPTSIAVLPLEATSLGSEAFLGDALAEETATSLAQYSHLRISSLTSTQRLAASGKTIPELASERQVNAILEGSIVRINHHDEINLRLIDGKTDRQLWSQQYQRNKDSLLGFQSQAGRDLVHFLKTPLSSQDKQRFEAAQTTNPEAYEAFLRARYIDGRFLLFAQRDSSNRDPFPQAVALLERAIRLDPNFVAAYSLLAKIDEWRVFQGTGPVGIYHDRATLLVEQVLHLDPDSSEGHFVKGLLSFEAVNGFNYEAAAREFKLAIEFDPSSIYAQGLLGILYMRIGLLKKAEYQTEILRQLDPAFPGLGQQFGQIYFLQRRYPEAYNSLQDTGLRSFAALALLYENAKITSEPVYPVPPELLDSSNAYDRSCDAIQLAASGHRDEAARAIALALSEIRGKKRSFDAYAFYRLGAANALLNNTHEALILLTYASENGFPCFPLFETDPALNNIRKDPAFIILLTHLRSDWERRSAEL